MNRKSIVVPKLVFMVGIGIGFETAPALASDASFADAMERAVAENSMKPLDQLEEVGFDLENHSGRAEALNGVARAIRSICAMTDLKKADSIATEAYDLASKVAQAAPRTTQGLIAERARIELISIKNSILHSNRIRCR